MPNQFSPKRPVVRPIGPSIAYVQSSCKTIFSLIDSDDADFVGQWCWFFNFKNCTKSHYVERTTKSGGKSGCQSLTYLLLGIPPLGMQIDHKNGLSLDNRRCNLRFATRSQQHQNQRINSANTSGCKGVSWNKKSEKWEVHIKQNGKRRFLGLFSKFEDAVFMRTSVEIEMFGEFSSMLR